jgi:hypothetical protein
MKTLKLINGILDTFLAFSWKIGLGIFFLGGIVNSSIRAVYDHSWGMIEGIGIGASFVMTLVYLLERKSRLKEERLNEKVKELMRDAHHCSKLAEQFERDGNVELQSQFIRDYNNKRHQILALLGGEIKPEDIKVEGR